MVIGNQETLMEIVWKYLCKICGNTSDICTLLYLRTSRFFLEQSRQNQGSLNRYLLTSPVISSVITILKSSVIKNSATFAVRAVLKVAQIPNMNCVMLKILPSGHSSAT